MIRSDSEKKLKDFIYQLPKKDYKKCLFFDKSCKGKIVNAHSIQNRIVLDKLAENGKVIMLTYKQDLDSGPKPQFKSIGKNNASTFTSLCEYHDNKIFEKIEKNEINLSDDNHLFLLAYRAVLREFHSSINTSRNVQDVFIKSKELDLPQSWNEEILEIMPVVHMLQSYMTYRFKFYVDKIFAKEQYHLLKHIVIEFTTSNISIAVNSMYAPINNYLTKADKEDPKFLMLNIFPLREKYYCVFSYRFDHENIIKEYLNDIIIAKDTYQLYLISKLVLQNSENFVINPSYFSKWSDKKQKDVIEYFAKNLYGKKIDYENENLLLF